jgi:hypothetical protein
MGSKASAIAAPSFLLGDFSHTLRLHAKLLPLALEYQSAQMLQPSPVQLAGLMPYLKS